MNFQQWTGKDPSACDFFIQIGLDANATHAARIFSDLLEHGGGVAFQGWTGNKFGIINIWSSIPAASDVQGGLVMDFDHEPSHLLGILEDWSFIKSADVPIGITIDDWIPYPMFGWTDSDGDGIPDMIDPMP